MHKLMRFGGVLLLAAPAAILASAGWPYSRNPGGEIKPAAARPARIEARLKFERGVADRIDAARTREASIRARVEKYTNDIISEVDAAVVRPGPLIMAWREIVAATEGEREGLSGRINDLMGRQAEQARDQGARK